MIPYLIEGPWQHGNMACVMPVQSEHGIKQSSVKFVSQSSFIDVTKRNVVMHHNVNYRNFFESTLTSFRLITVYIPQQRYLAIFGTVDICTSCLSNPCSRSECPYPTPFHSKTGDIFVGEKDSGGGPAPQPQSWPSGAVKKRCRGGG